MKKRIISLILAVLVLCFALAGCSTGGGNNAPTSDDSGIAYSDISEFLDEFKREDISVLDDDPDRFVSALIAAVKSCNTTDWESIGWEESSPYYESIFTYEAESVLLGLPADMRATVMVLGNDQVYNRLAITFRAGDNSGNNDAAVKLCEAMFARFGDAENIKIDDNDGSEHELRSEWKDEESDFSCEWCKSTTTKGKTESIYVYVSKGAFDVLGEVHSFVCVGLTYECS